MRRTILFLGLFLASIHGYAQLYYVSGIDQLIELNITGTSCSSSVVGPFINAATGLPIFAGDIAICPNGKLYINTNQFTYEVDPSTALCTLVSAPSLYLGISALGCSASNDLYGVGFIPGPGTVYEIDVSAGTTLPIGNMPFFPSGDLVFWGGNAYMASSSGIVDVNIGNPAASTLLFPTPAYVALTILADDCNALLGGSGNQLTRIDLITGATTPLCNISQTIGGLTTPSEFTTVPFCPFEIDLDGNDDSGATGFDFNSPPYTCLTSGGQPIADTDTKIVSSKSVASITVKLAAGVQSIGQEYLSISTALSNVNVSGNNTTMITLISNGSASTGDFENALKAIKYYNTANPLIGGSREIRVEATDIIGDKSNIANAYLEVQILPKVSLELGPDIEKCANTTTTIDANVPNGIFAWSTGEISESIDVTNSGNYSVTVTNGIDCPNTDNVNVINNPVYNVYIGGGGVLCIGEKALITCYTDFTDGIDITVYNQNNQQSNFYNIKNGFTFEVPAVNSTYTLLSAISNGTPCLTPLNNEVTITISPNYMINKNYLLCSGDSVLINNAWVKKEGTVIENLKSSFGCDSTVMNTVNILPVDSSFVSQTTCDPTAAGTIYLNYKNKNNCDSVIVKTVTLKDADTTRLFANTCRLSLAGTTSTVLKNKYGCDSIVILSTIYDKPDSTFVSKYTCDISKVGSFVEAVLSTNNCDSIIVTKILYVPVDSTTINIKTCDVTKAGTFINALQSAEGCDSIVTTVVKYVKSDSTFINKKTCDVAKAGTFINALQSTEGCDSIVTTVVKYVKSDSTTINKKTCDVTKAGTFINALQSIEGCDSIVTTVVNYVKSDSTFINKKTCDVSKAGTFINDLQSIEGCDSIVTTMVKYVKSDSTFINKKTCDLTKAGTFINALQSTEGCDSIVTTVVKYVKSDSTFINKKTCDLTKAGTFIDALQSTEGCDSIVTTVVNYVKSDSTFINKKTCDATKAGTFINALQSTEGCDSIVTTLVKYISSDTVAISVTTCIEKEAGIKTIKLTNINGCDSIINIDIKYIESQKVTIEKYTCIESEVGQSQITLTNANGCDSIITTSFVLLPIDSCKNVEYYFPNILIRNGQGANGTFTIYSNQTNAQVESLDIYDRWGNKVFTRKSFPTNNSEYGWNGSFNGKELVSGVYVYQCRMVNGERYYYGTVTVVER